MDTPFFVVGCPRSGTTLLRAMLDNHPRLAIPPESHFVVTLWPRRLGLRNRPDAVLEAALAHPRFAAWGLDADAVRAAVRSVAPAGYAEVMAAIFSAYADAHGKPRWGDKTPLYGLHMPLLAELFPPARFVHVIRDGREVAASLAATPTGAPNVAVAAFWWSKWVSRIRAAGARQPPSRYLEIRYERLVADPEPVLRAVCEHLGEDYEPAMLDYPRAVSEGATPVSVARHPNLLLPPRPGIRDWRLGLDERRRAAVEAVTATQLAALGYPTSPTGPGARAQAWRLRVAGFAMTWQSSVARARRPAIRSL